MLQRPISGQRMTLKISEETKNALLVCSDLALGENDTYKIKLSKNDLNKGVMSWTYMHGARCIVFDRISPPYLDMANGKCIQKWRSQREMLSKIESSHLMNILLHSVLTFHA